MVNATIFEVTYSHETRRRTDRLGLGVTSTRREDLL